MNERHLANPGVNDKNNIHSKYSRQNIKYITLLKKLHDSLRIISQRFYDFINPQKFFYYYMIKGQMWLNTHYISRDVLMGGGSHC